MNINNSSSNINNSSNINSSNINNSSSKIILKDNKKKNIKIRCKKCDGSGLIQREDKYLCKECEKNNLFRCYLCQNVTRGLFIECDICYGDGELQNN